MVQLNNLLNINGKDAWTAFHAFLGERNGESKNMNVLMRTPGIKELTTVDFHERDGIELPEQIKLSYKAIERPLQFWIIEHSLTELTAKYNAFMKIITAGKVVMTITGWRTYHLIYQDMAQQPEIFHEPGRVAAALFTIKFLEPKPTI